MSDRRAEALHEEQRHVDRVHARIDQLRDAARARAGDAAADRSGSTFQARFERDVVAHHHASRAARLTFGDREPIVFGRLDLADGTVHHIGRVSVLADDGDALLVDWRAPAAAAFYQATPAAPRDVARRRTLVTDGPAVRDLDDELLDVAAADALGIEPVTGQGALLAALERTRGPHMRDIVATIQADQDRIIRLPDTGTVVVTGGPGTGKTVVALHRVAYLLYTHRTRIAGRGVLVVGPSPAFTDYIARVLPALGEDDAVLRPLTGFAPTGAVVDGWDPPEVGAVKGDLAWVEISRRLVAAALPPIPPTTRVTFEGTSAVIPARDLVKARKRLLDRLDADREEHRYHDRTATAEDRMRDVLWRGWARAHRKAGHRPPDKRAGSGFDTVAVESAQVEMLRRCFWPRLDPLDVFTRLHSGDVALGEVADDDLATADQERVTESWREAGGVLRGDDVAVLDEIVALLGPPRPARDDDALPAEASGWASDRFQVHRPTVDVTAGDYRDFAHVVVDEAQDLTPLQWRMVARRGPFASWTVVGDLAQRSRVAEPATWQAVTDLIGRRHVHVAELTINYRTPEEVVALAREVLRKAGLPQSMASEPVRSSGRPPALVRADDVSAEATRVAIAGVRDHDGSVAVIAPHEHVTAVRQELAAARNRMDEAGRTALERIRVLDPRTAKGLEFDEVVVTAPDEIGAASSVGWHQLYVAVTRATQHLTLVARPDADVPGADLCRSVATPSAP